MDKFLTLPDVLRATGGTLVLPGGPVQTGAGAISPDARLADPFQPANTGSGSLTIEYPGLIFNGTVYDSRLVEPGKFFVALAGEESDGHLYLADAVKRGAAAAMVRRSWLETQSEFPPVPLVVVEDTLAAFQQLAGWWRAQYPDLNVIGITGSVGKTSTKELVAAVLGRRYNVFKSYKSFNNEYSLMPLILQLQDYHQQAVLEMGCGWAFGELTRVCAVAKPKIGVTLGVSHSHFGRMGSLENIARNKAELTESLPADGWAVLNGDDFRVKAMAGMTQATPFFYGSDPAFDLWAGDVETYGLDGIAFTLHYRGEAHRLELPLPGRHNVQLASAATAVGLLCGLSWDEIIEGLHDPAARVRLLVYPALNGATLIDDSYNASPVSTTAALELLAGTRVTGRRIALLADMLELGAYAEEGHRVVGRKAAGVVDQLVVTGELGRLIGEEALASGLRAEQVTFVNTKEEAASFLEKNLRPGDLLLVKASRGIALEDVVEKVRASHV